MTMRNKALRIGSVAAMFYVASMTAQAQTFVTGANTRGWIASDGSSNGASADNNYVAGVCAASCSSGGLDYRNFFTFAIPTFTGSVTSASVSLFAATVLTNQSSTLTYALTSTPSQSYAGLGSGVVYGSGTFSSSNSGTNLIFQLNAAGLAAIQSGGTFGLSGRLTSPETIGANQPSQAIFAFSNDGRTVDPTTLTFTAGASSPVPEPATWAMTILGLGLVGFAMRRRTVTTRVIYAV